MAYMPYNRWVLIHLHQFLSVFASMTFEVQLLSLFDWKLALNSPLILMVSSKSKTLKNSPDSSCISSASILKRGRYRKCCRCRFQKVKLSQNEANFIPV